MPLIKLKNNSFLQKEVTHYPKPEIVIEKIGTAKSIKFLGLNRENNLTGCVYLYLDRATNQAYVGETTNNPNTRFNATHKTAEWFLKMVNPAIYCFYGINKTWDTDTRQSIENLTIYSMQEHKIKVANRQINAPYQVPNHLGLSSYEIEDIANIILEYIQLEFGFSSDLDNHQTIPPIKAKKEITETVIAEPELKTEYVKYVHKKTVLWGYLNKNNRIVIVKAINIPESTVTYPSQENTMEKLINRHTQIISESIMNENGTYNWKNLEGTPEDRLTVWAAVFIGYRVSNKWKTIDETQYLLEIRE